MVIAGLIKSNLIYIYTVYICTKKKLTLLDFMIEVGKFASWPKKSDKKITCTDHLRALVL